jgi:hypothetical protein
MDALQMLREDHRKVKELFRQFEEAQGTNEKRAIAETVFVELDIHSVLEEEVFYPAVRRQGNGTGELVERAEQEHHLVDALLADLMKMEPGNMEFDAKFHTLIENVKSHIDEEEAEMLPVAAEVGLPRLEQLGERMEKRRAELLSEGQNGRRASTRATPTRRRTTATKTTRPATKARSTSSTRARSSTGTRSTRTSSARTTGTTSTTRARPKTARGTKSATAARRATTRAAGKNGTSATTRTRTVAQAGSRKRTTQTRSKMSGRRSGSQSGN